jgi:hypothetical protein
MKKRYIVLMVIGGLAAAPFGFRAGKAAKEKLSDWRDRYNDWLNND